MLAAPPRKTLVVVLVVAMRCMTVHVPVILTCFPRHPSGRHHTSLAASNQHRIERFGRRQRTLELVVLMLMHARPPAIWTASPCPCFTVTRNRSIEQAARADKWLRVNRLLVWLASIGCIQRHPIIIRQVAA